MMRVYICPDCGLWHILMVCKMNAICGVQDDFGSRLTYVSWSENNVAEYSAAWMYIHNKGKIKRN